MVDGELVAAVEEERFNRIKHWAGFPSESIRYCLDVGGVNPEAVDHVAISFDACSVSSRQRVTRLILRHVFGTLSLKKAIVG